MFARILWKILFSTFLFFSSDDYVSFICTILRPRPRDAFHRARANRPCVLFLDEIDAITMKRGDAGGTGTGMRVCVLLLGAFCLLNCSVEGGFVIILYIDSSVCTAFETSIHGVCYFIHHLTYPLLSSFSSPVSGNFSFPFHLTAPIPLSSYFSFRFLFRRLRRRRQRSRVASLPRC